MATGMPPRILVTSGYETKYGAAMITSSLLSSVAINALNMTCLAPLDTMISSIENSNPLSRLNFSMTAAFVAGAPPVAVYRVYPNLAA